MMDAQLASFATVRELEYLEALEKHGSVIRAAKALGVVRGSIQGAMANLRKRAALRGYAPECDMTKTVPDGFKVKGVSTFYGEDGKPKGQWVKSSADDERRQEMIRAAFEAMAQDLPRLGASLPIPGCDDRLATVYTLTDSHVGMLAWAREAGADWDLAIAERTLSACFARMVESSPAARVGFVNQLGDFLHSDGLLPVTPTSGHILDQDGRYTKLVETAVRILRRVVDLALTKHERVVVLMAEGNHDMASSVWLRTMFKALYENEPRITVDDSALPYYAYVHGEVLLGFHHSHLKKNPGLPILFAAQFAKEWGGTRHRYIHTGNLHHVEEKEHCGAIVFQHPTLAARDAYAARGGWHAGRGMNAISYHDKHGEVGRITVRPEMIG
jgi:hypothetical protein